ncbi:fatty acyl-CoA reductase wat-like isoform X2 [Lycorma delicatula]
MDYYDSRDYLTENTEIEGKSDIVDFFDGTSVLITGVTGFIGHLLLEKILRCCPGVRQIFLLIRMKKGVSEHQRLKELFENYLFYTVRKQDPNCIKKVTLISGDCSQPQLGLSDDQRKCLLDVNVVIHVAACLQFDAHFRNSFHTNVVATHYLLELAKKMKNIKAFTYVSTAYSHIDNRALKEVFEKPKYSYEEMRRIIDGCTDEQITGLMPLLLNNNTTYSLMKSISEDVVKEYIDCLPVGIVRPSIVINTYDEPIRSWINGINGQSATILGTLLGILHTLNTKSTYVIDNIPADKVVSAILASTWDIAINKQKERIYNVVSSKRNQITWKGVRNRIYSSEKVVSLSSKFSLWEPYVIIQSNRILDKILILLLHVMPACLVDIFLIIKGKKPMLMKLYRKASYLVDLMYVYFSVEWFFDDNNLYSLWEKMNPVDKTKFNFSMIDFNWEAYYTYYVRGLQLYVLKESTNYDDAVKSRHRRKWLKIAHYALLMITGFLVLWILKILTGYIFYKTCSYVLFYQNTYNIFPNLKLF